MQRATGWRGDGSGLYPSAKPPTKWSTTENVIWKTPMPDWSNGSPVVIGDKVLVSSEPATVICLNLSTGKILWKKSYGYAEAGDRNAQPPATHGMTGYSSPTVVSDGKYVYAASGPGTVACYDMDGNLKWIRLLEKFNNYQNLGNSASPILADGKLFVQFSSLHALDTATGRTVWKTNVSQSFGSPIAMQTEQATLIITAGGNVINASNGRILPQKLWDLQPDNMGNSPVVANGAVFMTIPAARAYRFAAGAAEPARLWEIRIKDDRYFASPVVSRGLIFALSWNGSLTVIDASKGTVVLTRQLRLGSQVYSSLTVCGGYLYASGENGTTIVMEADRQCREVAVNKLEGFRSCIVFADDKMLVRTMKALYCIGR